MNYGKKHDLPFGIMDVAGLLRLNIRRRAPGQVYVDCPICGDRRGKMNLNTEKDLWRCNYCGEGGGMLSLYAKVYGVSNSDAYREICDALAVNGFSPDYTVPEKTTPAEAEQSDAASVQEVHQTLSMLLSMLTLIPAHRAHLQSVRGLSDDEITRFGFKSTPPPFLCRSLTNRLVKAGCRVQGVPGFYVDDNGCWTVKFHQRTSGIIIPIFGVDGLIHGAQIRLDHPLKDKDDPPEKTGVKYLTLSSTGKRMGTTSGSPIHFVGDPCSRVVYVTEGCLKADVAHALMHRTFVATLGVNNTAKLDELFAFLHRNGTEEIIEAEDMDKYSNEMVEKGASKIYALAARHGMRCRRLTWNPNYKGIDDWQLALRRKEQKMKEDPGMTFKEQYLIVGLSEAILEKFIGKGWLHSYMDIFFLDKHRSEIVQMEGFGVRSWQNLWDAIQHSRITTFEQYLTAMDIPMVGSTASRAICQRFRGNLSEFETAVCMGFDFTQLPDFGETLHRNIHQWFRSEENWTVWTELRRLVCIKTYQPPAVGTDMSNPFVGKTLVVTGKVEPYTRDGINEKIESLGAHAGSSVSSKTDYLICGENAGSKLEKAQALGVKILSPGEFFRMAGESA